MDQIINVALSVFITQAVTLFFIVLISSKSDIFCKAYGLDFAVAMLTLVPWSIAYTLYGWNGVIGAVIGQLAVLYIFNFVHSMMHGFPKQYIKDALNDVVGPVRNHLGLFISLFAFPLFWVLRLTEIFVYPMLRWTLGFPKYKEEEWVNISRQKIDGLVGHDLVWCLYCDWMTGIYSYGAEMLRNVESFWCPIKFYDGKKCDNCQVDFPDINEWTPGEKLPDVKDLLLDKYPPKSNKPRGWFQYKDS